MNQQTQALTKWLMLILLLGGAIYARAAAGADAGPGTQSIVRQLDSPRGICAVVGDREARQAIELARASELTVYVQLDDAGDVVAARRAAEAAGLLNRRVYVEQGSSGSIASGGQPRRLGRPARRRSGANSPGGSSAGLAARREGTAGPGNHHQADASGRGPVEPSVPRSGQ